MARNSSGTYTAPTGQPVTSGTTISAATHNTLVSDLATELTDSLSRSGKGGMTAPLRTADGAVSAPAHSYTSETGSGWYRSAAGVVRLAILGTWRLLVQATGAIVNGTFGVQDPTGGKTTTLASPSGLAADQTITFPTALPGSTLPVSMSATGALSAAQITTAQIGDTQVTAVKTDAVSTATASRLVVRDGSGRAAFADPSASGDAATKSYVDTPTSVTLTPGTGWTLNTSIARRSAGLVSVVLTATAGVGSSWQTVGSLPASLPAGSRPPDALYAPCMVFDQNVATYYVGVAAISTDGNISLDSYDNGTNLTTPFAIATGDKLFVTVAFPVS